MLKEALKDQYGKLEKFKFKRRDDCPIKISVSVTAKTAFIRSYFWKDGEHFLELFVQINIKNKARLRQAEKTVKAVIESVEIIRINEKIYEECDKDLEDAENTYVCYLKPAVDYLERNIEEDFPMDESIYETDKNSDLEYDEWDTPYCACMMWKYQDWTAQDNVRKKRVMEFWEWYIKEAAKLHGIVIRTKVKIPAELQNFPRVEINTIEDFAEYIEYDFEYVNKYELRDNKQL